MSRTKLFLILTALTLVLNPACVKAAEPETPDVLAPSAVVMDAKTGAVLFDKNKDYKRYPASVTKLMTVLLTLEAVENKNEGFSGRVPFSHYAVYSLPYDSSHIAMDEDETLSVDEALYAVLLASANEVSNALAEYIGGSVEQFADMMTNRAKELGAANTRFANPHGLHDEQHYTTAYDMALIMREDLTHQKFKNVIATTRYDIPRTEKQPEPKIMNNSHKMILPSSAYYNSEVVGGKTGYTSEAKHTLATYGQRDGAGVIVVVMAEETSADAYNDTGTLLDYWLGQYETITLLESGGFKRAVPVVSVKDGGETVDGVVEISNAESVTARIPRFIKTLITIENDLPDEFDRPITEGEKLGVISFLYGNAKIAEADVVALNSAAPALGPNEQEFPESGLPAINIDPSMLKILKIIIAALGALALIRVTLTALQRRARRSLRYKLQKNRDISYKYKNHRF